MFKKTMRMISLVILGLLICGSAASAADTPPGAVSPTHDADFQPGEVLFQPAAPSQDYTPMAVQAANILPWSRLVFQSYRDGNWEIYTANDDGSAVQRVTNHAAMDTYPRLNRGATRLAFVSNRSVGNYEVFVTDIDGSNGHRLASNPANDYNPAWSPDSNRIIFNSYRDGQSELYVMDADGANLTRLTFDGGYDGGAIWSPDGSKIAFRSDRSGGAAIWVMNTDGSAPTILATQPYAENPAWSPDGTQIAYDADGNGDGWQEVWVMNSDGTNQRQVYDPGEPTADAWVRSWSPDGRYIAFTRINFVQYYGNWYWSYAYLDAIAPQTGALVRLNSSDTEWYPDWQTTDITAPTSQLNPLPVESPSPIAVSWSGTDVGASGLGGYTVQVKDGAEGVWTNWLTRTWETAKAYPGIGGHTYYFRLMARDYASNVSAWSAERVTRVETYPPQSHANTLPAYTRYEYEGFPVSWSVTDPGRSTIQSFEVQYRVDNGAWRSWLVNPAGSSALFQGAAGHTYAFRTKAVDSAQNAELWPEGDGDTQTTLYIWGITGKVLDNAGTPVSGATISTTPAAMKVFTGSLTGDYAAYVVQSTDWYTFNIGKPGYGILPATTFPLATDAGLDVVLPPVDNVIRDWGFESGSLNNADWQSDRPARLARAENLDTTSGEARIITDVVHTGHYATEMGSTQVMDDLTLIYDDHQTGYIGTSCMVQLSDGTLHILWPESPWTGGQNILYYMSRNSQGIWSTPQGLTIDQTRGGLQCTVGLDDAIHVVFNTSDVFYMRRDSNGTWSEPLNISNDTYSSEVSSIAVDASGKVHVAWLNQYESSIDSYGFYYTQRSLDGNWITPYKVSGNYDVVYSANMSLDTQGMVHFLWSGNDFWYRYLNAQGQWGQISFIADNASHFETTMGTNGTLHVKWHIYDGGSGTWYTYYTRKSLNGSFSTPIRIPEYISGLFLAYQDLAYIFWTGADSLCYVSTDGKEFTASELPGPADYFLNGTVDNNGVLHVIWGYKGSLYYAYWHPTLGQSAPQAIAPLPPQDSTWFLTKIIADDIQQLHLLRFTDTQLYYWGPALAPESEDYAVAQVVTSPSTITHPVLSYFYRLGGSEANSDSGLMVQVEDGLGTATLFTTTQNSLSWQHQTVDMRPWQGQSITLTFKLHQSANTTYAYAYLDEVSLGSANPDIWVSGGGTLETGGDSLVYTIHYGNRGGAPADNVRIAYLLPPELTLMDATPHPITETAQLPAWLWDVGTLPANSGPFTIVLTATVAPTVPMFSTLVSTASITSTSPELELANNTAIIHTLVAYQLYLPLVTKN